MATWMVHLRVADRVFHKLYDILPYDFIVGNIAPDCGVPNEDWSVFTPSKKISHFEDDSGDYKQFAENFAKKYLQGRSHTREEFSFYLGYYVHLVTDELWYQRIYQVIKKKYEDQFAKDKGFIWTIKKDWYDLDFCYLRSHSDFWTFMELKKAMDYKNLYMEEFEEFDFANRIKYIVEFYESSVKDLDREYLYFSEEEANNFVEEAVTYLLSDEILGDFFG